MRHAIDNGRQLLQGATPFSAKEIGDYLDVLESVADLVERGVVDLVTHGRRQVTATGQVVRSALVA